MSQTNGNTLQCPLCQARYPEGAVAFCTRDGARLRPLARPGQRWEGEVIKGRFRITRFLGAGGMAEVYEAVDEQEGTRVAVKLLRPQLAAEPAMVERFRFEATLVSLIDHPGVVRLFDYGALEEGTWYMVMELLEGISLEQALDEQAIDPALALDLGIQACDALQAAHDKKVVHRDVKPANLFIVPDGDAATGGDGDADALRLKILDLGIAKLLGEAGSNLTATGMVFGTPEYMSPEQALGEPVTPRSDIYSLGVVLFRALTGSVPFQADSFVGVLTRQVSETPHWPEALVQDRALPTGTAGAIMRALAKNPMLRYGSMREFQAVLRQLRARLAAPAPGRSPLARAPGAPVAVDRSAPTAAEPARRDRGTRSSTVRRLALDQESTGGDSEVVEIAEGIYWVGRREGVTLERNSYLCTYRGEGGQLNLLVDPGPPKDLAALSAKVGAVIGSLERVDLLFLNHQDPDVAANASVIQELNPRAHVWCSEDSWRLVCFFGLKPGAYSAIEHFPDRRTTLVTGHRLRFVPTPFCHFRGAVMLYDERSRTLFSGDLFGGLSAGPQLLATAADWSGIEIFHQLYMPSRRALRRAVAAVRALDPPPLLIAPQHGGIIRGELMEQVLARMDALQVGIDLLADESSQEPTLRAINETIEALSSHLSPEQLDRALSAFAADGTFPRLFVLEAGPRVREIKIAPRAALEAFLAQVRQAQPAAERPALEAIFTGVLRRHGLVPVPSAG